MPSFPIRSAAARVLNLLFHEDQFTPADLAVPGGCSDRLLLYVAAQEKSLTMDRAERISRYLCRHGETRLAGAFLSPDYVIVPRATGEADGCVQDELIQIVEALGDINRTHTDRDPEVMSDAIARARAALDDLEAECASL